MKTVWQVNADRYGDESRAKSEDGRIFSVVQTADLLIEKYKVCEIKPEIEVVAWGIGRALADYLRGKGVPCTTMKVLISRVGSADVISYRKEET